MFLLDDILLFPATGIQWIAQAVNRAAEEAMAGGDEEPTAGLREP